MRVDYKFLNFRVNIEKILKLHELKIHFPLFFKLPTRQPMTKPTKIMNENH
jgi:hypothetical protein